MTALEVWLHGQQVGLLEQIDEEEMERNRLTFSSDWWTSSSRAVLGQFFEDRAPAPVETHGPMSWFAHLLPQGPLRRAIARQADVHVGDVIPLLAYLGQDLPGAVILKPGEALVKPRRSLIRLSEPGPTDPLRFSLAGQQWKLSLRRGDKLTVPLSGESGRYIGKLPSRTYSGLPRVEHATMTWAQAAGLDTPTFELVRLSEIEIPAEVPVTEDLAFVIERFDRTDTGRVHIEDFAQILDVPPGDRIYGCPVEHLAAVVAALCPQDLRDLVRQVVFCIVAGNGDAHLKNWSLVYPDQRTARLAPPYDLVSTVLYGDGDLAFSLGGRTRYEDVMAGSFHAMARSASLDTAEVDRWVREDGLRCLEAFEQDLGFSADEVRQLREHHARIPICAGPLAPR